MRPLIAFLATLSVLLAFVTPASGASCQFVLGFKALHDLIPQTVGPCLVDEHHNPSNGDGLQETAGSNGASGLLVWRKADNWTAYTDGYRTWINGPSGLQVRLNTQRFSWESAAQPQILHVTHYVDIIGYTHMLGEVVNNSGASIFSPQVKVTYFNADSTVAGTATSSTELHALASGEKSPFDVDTNPQSAWTRYDLSLTYNTSSFLTYSHTFQFAGQNSYNDGFVQHYLGQVTNTAGRDVGLVNVVLTGYDANGNVVGVGDNLPLGLTTMRSGQSAAYKMDESLSEGASKIVSVAIVAEGQD